MKLVLRLIQFGQQNAVFWKDGTAFEQQTKPAILDTPFLQSKMQSLLSII